MIKTSIPVALNREVELAGRRVHIGRKISDMLVGFLKLLMVAIRGMETGFTPAFADSKI